MGSASSLSGILFSKALGLPGRALWDKTITFDAQYKSDENFPNSISHSFRYSEGMFENGLH